MYGFLRPGRIALAAVAIAKEKKKTLIYYAKFAVIAQLKLEANRIRNRQALAHAFENLIFLFIVGYWLHLVTFNKPK